MPNILQRFFLPKVAFIIILGTLVSRFGTSIVEPYITTMLVEVKHVPLFWPGIVLSVSYLAQMIAPLIISIFLKKACNISLIKYAVIIYGLMLLLIWAFGNKFINPNIIGITFTLSFLICGGCRSIIETSGQTVISNATPEKQKFFAFNLRYTFINIGTAIGPIIALMLGLLATHQVFLASSLSTLVYFLLLLFIPKDNTHPLKSHSLKDSAIALFKDKTLYYYIIANILMFVGFTQQETLFAFITYKYTHNLKIYVVMSTINCLTIILLQIPIIELLKRKDLFWIMIYGTVLMGIGILVTYYAKTTIYLYYVSIFIFTIGEIFTISLTGIFLDKIAPLDQKFLYYSLGNLALAGRVIGPALTGILCYKFGLEIGIFSIVFLVLLSIPALILAKLHYLKKAYTS